MAGTSRTIRVASLQLGPITLEAGILGAVEDDDAGLVSLCQHAGDAKHAAEGPARIKRRDYGPACDNDDKATFAKGKVTGDSVVILDAAALTAIRAAGEAH